MIDQSQFTISEFKIKSGRFEEALDINPVLIAELNIYESIRMPFLTGNFLMIDDIGKWAEFNAIYTSYFTPPYPARSAMGADGLALGAALELECIAVQRQ